MRLRALLAWAFVIVLLLAGSVAGAADGAAARLGEDWFGAGAAVELAEPVDGDALLAGGTVESNASVGGDLTAAGGRVAVRAAIGDDLYAAGGRVEVDALVHGNARIAGGQVVIAPESRIEGRSAVAGGTVDLRGRFGRNLTVAGGDVTLGGEVAGDVAVYAESLRVLPGTRIGGRLSYRTAEEVVLPPDVQVVGGVEHEQTDAAARNRSRWSAPFLAVGWLWIGGLFALGLVLALSLAAFSLRASTALAHRPWAGLGVGFLVLVCVPAVALALFITLIGIPVALVLLLVYLAMLIVGYVVGALFLADRLLERASPGGPRSTLGRLVALLLVLVALAFINSLPLIGGLVRLAVLLLGLGGIVLAFRTDAAHPVRA